MAEKNKEYTPEEIVKLVTEKRKSQAYQELISQMDEHFDLYSLVEEEVPKGHLSYTSPAPLNDFNKVFASLNKAALTYQVTLPASAPESEREKASKGENLLYGIFDRVDREFRKNMKAPLRQSLGWYGCARGIAALRCLIYPDGDSEDQKITIDINSWDPRWMAWELGSDGFVWVGYLYHVSKAEAKERWDKDLGDENEDAIVIDFYTRKMNAVVLYMGFLESEDIGNAEFVKNPMEHKLSHVPVYIGFAGGMPDIRSKDNQLALKQRAGSVYAASGNVYGARNKQTGFLLDMQQRSVAGTLAFESKMGKKLPEGDPFGSWKVIPLVAGEDKIYPLETPKSPPETGALMQVFDRDKQESTVPYPIGYGLDPQPHSGAALAILTDNTRSIYGPFTALIENAYHWLCEEIFSQFKMKGGKMKLQGYNPKGEFFVVDVSPEDIDDSWYVEVKCEPKLPRDEANELAMAIQATMPRPNGRPFLSDITAYERIIQLPDSDAERKRIDNQLIREKADQIPNIMLRKIANSLIKQGDEMIAKEILSLMPAPPSAQGEGQPVQPPMEQPVQPPMGQPPMGPPVPQQLTPQEMEQLMVIAQTLQAQGRPIPPELQMILAQVQPQPMY